MRIICLGDSNTIGFDPRSILPSEYERPWPTILSELLNTEVINCGENGIGIYHTEDDFQYLDSILHLNDLILIMLGSNDVLNGLLMSEIERRWNILLNYLKGKNVLLLCPKDIKGFPSLKELYIENKQFNVLDCNGWNIEMSYDGIHFSQRGHEQIAIKIFNYLNVFLIQKH